MRACALQPLLNFSWCALGFVGFAGLESRVRAPVFELGLRVNFPNTG